MPDSTLIRVTSVQYTVGQEPVLIRWELAEPTGLLALLSPGQRLLSTTQTALNARAVAREAPVWSDEDVAAELVDWFTVRGVSASVVTPSTGGGDEEEGEENEEEEDSGQGENT